MYHSISEHVGNEKHNKWRVKPRDFEKQMNWFFKNNWKSFTISELVKLDKIPEKSFVITFDDGFEDNFINAFPILKKYDFKATIYLVPNQKTNHWEEKNTSVLSNLLNEKQILEDYENDKITFKMAINLAAPHTWVASVIPACFGIIFLCCSWIKYNC